MMAESIQNESVARTTSFGAASSVCECRDYNIGVSNPIVILADSRIRVEDYLSQANTQFSFEEMERYWSDYPIEPEHLFKFLTGQTEKEVLDCHPCLSTDSASVFISNITSSDLALRAGIELLRERPGLTHEIEGVIYYSATLNTRLAWSTSCRLHFELGLKCETAFTIGQKGANGSYAALKAGTEMLHVEGLTRLLLVGSERFAPPHSRVFSGLGVQGDSASAMLLTSGAFQYKLCCIILQDFFERPPHPARSTDEERLDFWSEAAVMTLCLLLASSGLRANDIQAVVPPNCSIPLLRRIAAKSGIPWERFQIGALRRFGFLGSSDLAANLYNMDQSATLRSGDDIISFGFSSDGSVCGCVFRYEPQWSVR